MLPIDRLKTGERRLTIAGAPEGLDARILAELAHRVETRPILHVARDDGRLSTLASALGFFAPDIKLIEFPAWDCLPYDRVSPNPQILAKRMSTLARLARGKIDSPTIILTTVNAITQRLPARSVVKKTSLIVRKGDELPTDKLLGFLVRAGFTRSTQVTEPGEFAQRGGIIDLFPPNAGKPFRLDFFGDTLDSLRRFDPLTQRTLKRADAFRLIAMNEYGLDPTSISRFRQGYVARFGAITDEDPLYASISDGRRHAGAEHWLPLFHQELETLFEYLPDAITVLDHQADEAAEKRLSEVADYYAARREALEHADASRQSLLSIPYKPLEPEALYLSEHDWQAVLEARQAHTFSPFQEPDSPRTLAFAGKRGRDFAAERASDANSNIYDTLASHIEALMKTGKRVWIACYSDGARERMAGVLADHKIGPLKSFESAEDADSLGTGAIALVTLAIEQGFETDDLAVISEQDILGDRLIRKGRRRAKADNFLTEATSLSPGDLIVHLEHGVGRFEGLETIPVGGAPHDCLKLIYRDDDKLYVPVENIEILSRFGSDAATVHLDKLGGGAWQARKAKLKKRIREMADELIKVAAARELREGEVFAIPDGAYDEFCARFPFSETDDQLRAIEAVLDDFASGKPMDRLVCGDVGFGKTEVALRAAFVAALAGVQVAIVAPTTLLARQHYRTFSERFKGLPVRIAHLSRLVSAKDATSVRSGLGDGTIDIVVGTHALLAKGMTFKRLGFLIIDEEQHFGVAHKERLKQLKADVHVLTLTATPIPRTLQLAMSGIRDLSLIATPPVDRLAVRTFVLPFDEMVVREALMREHYRGGQSFYVVPRIADLDEAMTFLKESVPEIKPLMAHGQMAPGEIEDRMNAFYEGRYDVLVSTTIVESGLDIPSANTMVIHRADMFGLAQLYQLRGRVGRSKVRAYAYLTTPSRKPLTPTASKRLEVLQSLDTLGAGFTLASHDLDIRGAGNLLGDEQSGHIREVGVELYQQMLEEAVAEAKAGNDDALDLAAFSPQISLGASVLIPEGYVPDLPLRMALYRRLGGLENRAEIDEFAAELIDRFGKMPSEVEQLIAVTLIKTYCRQAGIEKIEAGPKGATISFRNNKFANPAGLVAFISQQPSIAKLRPDHKLVYGVQMSDVKTRIQVVTRVARELAEAAAPAEQAA